MLLQQEQRTVTSSGVMQVARATIKPSTKIFNFFEKQTYSNVPHAICRELAANAVDSHVMAGKPDLPIEVWLPTLMEPTFMVRDHGLGMSHEFMMNDFMAYADGSTKDGSNEAIGGFGIGSKSPFAYVDQYTITSRFDGTESIYTVFKDEEGYPSIGLLGQRETAEPNGVDVSFPIKQEDFQRFEDEAFKALQYFEPLPLIKNATEGQFNPPHYVTTGPNWGMLPNAGPLGIIMGGVRYPVNADSLAYKIPSNSPAQKLLKYGIDLRLPIGTCSIALSREALGYDDKTVNAIKDACEAVIGEVAEKMANMFDAYETPWEAAVALHKEIGDGYGPRSNFLGEYAKWRGEPLKTKLPYPHLATFKNYKNEVETCPGYYVWKIDGEDGRKARRGKTKAIGSAKWDHPELEKRFEPAKVTLVIDDLPQSPKHKAIKKIKEYGTETGEALRVIRLREGVKVSVDQILEGFGNPPRDAYVLTSELPEPIVDRIIVDRKKGDRPKVRMFEYNGQHDGYGAAKNNINPGQYGRQGLYEVPYPDQPDTGILVVMESFQLPAELRPAMSTGLLSWHELRFVNVGDAKKLTKQNWARWDVEYEKRKKAALAEFPDLAQRLAVRNEGEFHEVFDFFRRHPGTDFTSGKPLGRLFKLYQQYVQPVCARQLGLARFVTPKLPRGVKPEELMQSFKTKQWKAVRLMGALSTIMDESDMKLFQENL